MKVAIIISAIAIISVQISCSSKIDYSGMFVKKSGTCSHNYIQLRKVQGFGDRYYLIYTLKEGETWRDGEEFLGVIRGNLITINSYTITLYNASIHVRAKEKSCIYQRYVPKTPRY